MDDHPRPKRPWTPWQYLTLVVIVLLIALLWLWPMGQHVISPFQVITNALSSQQR